MASTHSCKAVALGNFLEGRVWIEDENGQATTVLKTMDRSCFMESSYVQCFGNIMWWLSSSCLTASIATVSTQASPSYSEPTIPECRLTSLLVGFTRNRDNPSNLSTKLC